ncbi:MAG: hypothetical protein ABI689_14210 [Thermoanaerobaculia bacterium]
MKSKHVSATLGFAILIVLNSVAVAYSLAATYVSVAERASPELQALAADPASAEIAIRRARSEGVAFMQRLIRPYVLMLSAVVVADLSILALAVAKRRAS